VKHLPPGVKVTRVVLPQRFNEDKRGGCAHWVASTEAPWGDAGDRLIRMGRNRTAAIRKLDRAFAEAI
jgi:hypothetical protein